MSKINPKFQTQRESTRSAKMQKYSAPALEKGLEIIEFLATQREPRSMQQIAVAVGRSKNEIFRMIIVLEESNYVSRQDADSFILTDKLYHLGLRQPSNKRITDITIPLMDGFAASNPYSCYLAVPSGTESVVIATSESPLPFGLTVTLGHRLPLDQSAEGLCMLSFMPVARRDQLLARLGFSEKTNPLQDDLNGFRAAGGVVRENDLFPGVINLAMPILNPVGDGVVAAIGVPYMDLKNIGSPLNAVLAELKSLIAQINNQVYGAA